MAFGKLGSLGRGFGSLGSLGSAGTPAGYDLILLGDSTEQQNKTSTLTGTTLDAMARGAVYAYMGTNKNVYHANECDATNYWDADPNAVARRGYTNGANYAMGGSSTYGSVIDLYAADGTTPAELAKPWTGAPSRRRRRIVIIATGTNDCNSGRTGAAIIAKLQAAAAYVLAKGDIPVIRTILARTSDNVTYPGIYWALNDDKRNQMGIVNDSITGGTWCGSGQAIEVWDPNVDIADTGVADNWGRFTTPLADMLGDGLHPSSKYGALVGQGSLKTTLDRIIPVGTPEVWTTPVLNSANLAYAGSLNVGLTGTAGAKSGTGVTGVYADGWALLRGGSAPTGGSTSIAIVGSKEAISTGLEKQVLTITPGGATTYESFTFVIYSAGTNITLPVNISVGQRIRMLLDIEASAWDGWTGFQTELVWMNSSNTAQFRGSAAKQGNALTDRIKGTAFALTLVTEPLLVPATTAKFSLIMTLPILCAATGTGVLKISNLRWLLEDDPSTIWPPG